MEHEVEKKLQKQQQIFIKWIVGIVVFSVLVMMILISLIAYISINKTQTKLVAPTIKGSITVGRDYVDENYLAQTAEYLLWLRLNITPAIVVKNYSQLLAYVDSADYKELQPTLAAESATIKKHSVSSVFYIKDTRINLADLQVKIIGSLQKYAKGRPLPKESKAYILSFKHLHGTITLSSIVDVSEQDD